MVAKTSRFVPALAGAALAGVLGAAACSEGNGDVVRSDPQRACAEGETQSCPGPEGCEGERHCEPSGLAFGECECAPDVSTDGGAGGTGGLGETGGAGAGGRSAGGDGGAACSASCDLQAPAVCSDGARSVCLELMIGCAEPATFDCNSGFCADELSCGVCPQQCGTLGDPGCAKGALRTCEADARGCLVWGAAESECASGFCATDGQGCGTCSHECPTTGVTECQAGQFRRCSEDAFGCRRWWFWAACELGTCADATRCASGYSQRQRGSPLDDEPLALSIDSLGRIVMAGGYHEFDVDLGGLHQELDAHLHVTAPDGNLKIFESWGAALEADEAVAVAVTSDNSYVLVGFTDGAVGAVPNHGGRDAFISKWTAEQVGKAPALLYSRQWGSTADEAAASVALDRDDTAYVLGSTLGELASGAAAGDADLFLTRWDSAGNGLGTWQWGTAALDRAATVLVDPDDGVLIAGTTEGAFSGETQAGAGDAFVSRLNADGSVAWTTQFGTTGNERVAQMIFDRQGNLLVLGTTDGTFPTNSSAGQSDTFLSKLDATGTLLFTRQWGTSDGDAAAGLAQAPDGRIFAAVTVDGAEPGCEPGQALLLEWNEAATQPTSRLFDTCEEERATAITVDPNGVVYMAGATRGSLVADQNRGGTDIFVIVSQISN